MIYLKTLRPKLRSLCKGVIWTLSISICTLATAKDQVKQVKVNKSKPNTSYKNCRKQAIKRLKPLKDNKLHSRILKESLQRCKEKTPAVAVLKQCQKEAVRAYADNRDYLKTALKECKGIYKSFEFNGKKPLPLKMQGDLAYFGGIGLNSNRRIQQQSKESPDADLNRIGNFDCGSLEDIFYADKSPEYVLFGNSPNAYFPLSNRSLRDLSKELKMKLLKKKSYKKKHPFFGRIYYEARTKRFSNYFPSSSCQYSSDNLGIYEALQVQYLVDKEKKIATPYFGVAFYGAQSKVKTKSLIKKLRAELGEDFILTKSKSGLDLLSKAKIGAFDYDGDPWNLCQPPRQHNWLAAIQSEKKTGRTQYLVLANIRSLCRFGDRMASRYLKSRSNPL